MIGGVGRVEKRVEAAEEETEEGRRRYPSSYQGRRWRQGLSDFLVAPLAAIPASSSARIVYADRILEAAASKWLRRMMTLEEKVAQLCFYVTEACYDSSLQYETELLIQSWQVGGLFFTKGHYQRQAYLIEEFQKVSKTTLLMGNDFLHGLSLYLEEDELPRSDWSERHCADLGKVVMSLNRRLGVQVQCVQERNSGFFSMNSKQVQAFRRGIREAQGVVGKIGSGSPFRPYTEGSLRACFPFSVLAEMRVCERVGFRTMTFCDLTALSADLERKLTTTFKEPYDAFLLHENTPEVIRVFCKLVRQGQIREQDLEKRILKILMIKALYNAEWKNKS